MYREEKVNEGTAGDLPRSTPPALQCLSEGPGCRPARDTTPAGVIAAAFFGLTGYAGFQLLKENEKGLEIARAIIAIQIISFHIAGLGYSFVTGAYLFVGITNAQIGFKFGLETNLSITLADESTDFVLRLNLLAIIAFIYLSRLLKQVEDDNDILDAVSRQNEESATRK